MNQAFANVAAALAGDGYVALPIRAGAAGDGVSGFDAASSVTLVVVVDQLKTGTVDVLVEGSADGATWATVHDFSSLTHASSPALYLAAAPPARLRVTAPAGAQIQVRAFPHPGPGIAGVLMLPGLPTSDPHVAGQVWNSTGTLKVSSG